MKMALPRGMGRPRRNLSVQTSARATVTEVQSTEKSEGENSDEAEECGFCEHLEFEYERVCHMSWEYITLQPTNAATL